MSKVTVTICDNCSEQVPTEDNLYRVLVEGGDMAARQGDLCESCAKGLGLHGLPERKKRQKNQ